MRYQKILVPLDGSKLSESILPYALSFAEAFKTPLELLHVVDLEALRTLFSARQGRPIDVVETELKSAAMKYLEGITASLPGNLNIRQTVELGMPAEVALGRADNQEETLIAMATHGLSGSKRWIVGSVANKILHRARSPLLVIKPAAEQHSTTAARLKRVLVPLDGSAFAEQVLSHVTIIATVMDLNVELFQAYSLPISAVTLAPHSFVYPGGGSEFVTGEVLKEDVESYLMTKMDQLRTQEKVLRVSYSAAHGDAAEQIISTAQSTRNTLTAMSTHGRTGMGRWLLGSVAERVVQYSGDPVLLIRPSA